MHMVFHIGVLALTVLALSRATSGVWLKNPPAAITWRSCSACFNWSLGWLIRLLLVVPTIMTLGLLLLFTSYIVNTVLLWAADKLLASFENQKPARAAAVIKRHHPGQLAFSSSNVAIVPCGRISDRVLSCAACVVSCWPA